MKILLDTCVVIDFLQKREPFAQDAYDLFLAIAMNQVNGCITAKAATDIYYLSHRFTHSDKESRQMLGKILSLVELLDTKADDIFQALVSATSDFEDAVMIETAKSNYVEAIITRNTKDYSKAMMSVYTPAEFLKILK